MSRHVLCKRQTVGRLELWSESDEQPRECHSSMFWTPWSVGETLARVFALWGSDLFEPRAPQQAEASTYVLVPFQQRAPSGDVVAEALGAYRDEPFVIRATAIGGRVHLQLGVRGRDTTAVHIELLRQLEGVAPKRFVRDVRGGPTLQYPEGGVNAHASALRPQCGPGAELQIVPPSTASPRPTVRPRESECAGPRAGAAAAAPNASMPAPAIIVAPTAASPTPITAPTPPGAHPAALTATTPATAPTFGPTPGPAPAPETITAQARALQAASSPAPVIASAMAVPLSASAAAPPAVAAAAPAKDSSGDSSDVCVSFSPDRTMACAVRMQTGRVHAVTLVGDDEFSARATAVVMDRFAAVCTERSGQLFVIDTARPVVYASAKGDPPLVLVGSCGPHVVCRTRARDELALARVIVYDTTAPATPPRSWAAPRDSIVRPAGLGRVAGVLSWSEHDPRGRVTLHAFDGTVRAHFDTAAFARHGSGAILDVAVLDGGVVAVCCRPRGSGAWWLHFAQYSGGENGARMSVSGRCRPGQRDWTMQSITRDPADGSRVLVRFSTSGRQHQLSAAPPAMVCPVPTKLA